MHDKPSNVAKVLWALTSNWPTPSLAAQPGHRAKRPAFCFRKSVAIRTAVAAERPLNLADDSSRPAGPPGTSTVTI